MRGAEFCGLVAGVKCDAVLKQRRSHQQPSSTGEKKCAALPRGSHNAKKTKRKESEREKKLSSPRKLFRTTTTTTDNVQRVRPNFYTMLNNKLL